MKVYKYLSPERIDVLENLSIRFTQAKYLNDPFESLPFISRLMSEAESAAFYRSSIDPIIDEIGDRKLTINDIPEEYRDQIPKEIIDYISTLTIKQGLELIPGVHPKTLTKMLLSSTAEEMKINFSEKLKESWNKYFGILSLTQTNDNITMWSHYAQNHEGFVIELDPDNEFFDKRRNDNDCLGYLREVKYTDERPNIELVSFQKPEEEFIEYVASQILYTKSQHWFSEKELRLVYNLKNPDKQIFANGQQVYLFRLPPNAIKGIFIGVNAIRSTIDKIEKIMQAKEFSHVQLNFGQLDLKDYRIKFNKTSLK